jgi:serine/threonine protein phosphatase PrpC
VCPKIAVEAAADTHVGRRRVNNEDSFGVVPEMSLFMVADGLGGKAAGEVASRMAVEVVRSLGAKLAGLICRAFALGGPDNVTCVPAHVGVEG